MRILIDTNILMDYFEDRTDFVKSAEKVFSLCAESKEVDGFVAAHSVMDLCYLNRKKSREEKADMLQKIFGILAVVETTEYTMWAAIEKEGFPDFEDSVINQAALKAKADYIVTRDTENGHFKHSDVPTITPDDFIKLFETKEQAE